MADKREPLTARGYVAEGNKRTIRLLPLLEIEAGPGQLSPQRAAQLAAMIEKAIEVLP